MTQPGNITVSLRIENTYELYEDVVTTVTDKSMPAPPSDEESDAYQEWAEEHINSLTGTGRTKGDSWYDVTVTACSDPELVGREFAFGY